jgi:hypothetical protein
MMSFLHRDIITLRYTVRVYYIFKQQSDAPVHRISIQEEGTTFILSL